MMFILLWMVFNMSKYTIQDIFIKYGPEYTKNNNLSNDQWKVYNAIINCGTKKLGSNIKDLRIKNNYSQANLANKLNVTQACIVRWEKGITKISIANLYKLARLFKVSLNELCYFS